MKDVYFIAGLGLGAIVGMAIMFKSKMARQAAHKCEEGITEVAETIKQNFDKKKATKDKK